MANKRKQQFQPFWHDELEVKQEFLKLAKDFTTNPDHSESLAHELAGGLLYANIAEYAASHLLESLKAIVKDAAADYYFGVASIDLPDTTDRPLGNTISELSWFEFPQRTEILDLLKKIKAARDKLSHQIIKVPASKLGEIDKSVHQIAVNTEMLLNKVDQIYGGMPPKNMKEKYAE